MILELNIDKKNAKKYNLENYKSIDFEILKEKIINNNEIPFLSTDKENKIKKDLMNPDCNIIQETDKIFL